MEEFLKFLKIWENSGEKRCNRLTSQTAFGLRVTLTAALELTDYLTSKVGFQYFMTRRMNQDALEVGHILGKNKMLHSALEYYYCFLVTAFFW